MRQVYLKGDLEIKLCTQQQFLNCSKLEKTHAEMCSFQCPKDCVIDYYNFQVKPVDYDFVTIVTIHRKDKEEIIFKYLPKITFAEYFGLLSSLLSFFFGVCMLNVIDMVRALRKLRLLRKQEKELLFQSFHSPVKNENNANIIGFCKLVVYLYCSGLALYQALAVSKLYLTFATQVNVNLVKPDFLSLPAVTFCTHSSVIFTKTGFMEMFPQLNHELLEANNDTKHILRLYSKYHHIIWEHLTSYFVNNHTINYRSFIQCKLYNKTLKGEINCTSFGEPLESISETDNGKCFTFFSDLSLTQNRFMPNLKLGRETNNVKFAIDFRSYNHSVRLSSSSPFIASGYIHDVSSLERVASHNRLEIKPAIQSNVYFSKTNVNLLPSPFETKCRHYQRMSISREYRSRYSCVRKCLNELCIRHLNCTKKFTLGSLLADDDKQRKGAPICTNVEPELLYFTCQNMQEKSDCKAQCPPECHNEYYYFKSSEDLLRNDKPKTDIHEAGIALKALKYPIVTYNYVAAITFDQFFSCMGGIFSLWLGFSITGLYDQIVAIAARLHIAKVNYMR